MTNRPRAIGTAAETAVVKVLRANGFGQAERRPLHGSQDWGDIYGTPGIAWEVKAGEQGKAAHGRPTMLAAFLAQTQTERVNSGSDIGVLVLARKGFPRADRWWAVLWVSDLVTLVNSEDAYLFISNDAPVWLELGDLLPLLRDAGYGDPMPETVTSGVVL